MPGRMHGIRGAIAGRRQDAVHAIAVRWSNRHSFVRFWLAFGSLSVPVSSDQKSRPLWVPTAAVAAQIKINQSDSDFANGLFVYSMKSISQPFRLTGYQSEYENHMANPSLEPCQRVASAFKAIPQPIHIRACQIRRSDWLLIIWWHAFSIKQFEDIEFDEKRQSIFKIEFGSKFEPSKMKKGLNFRI